MAVKAEQQQTWVIWSWFPVTLLTAIFCCVLWGSASPAIKIAYEAMCDYYPDYWKTDDKYEQKWAQI